MFDARFSLVLIGFSSLMVQLLVFPVPSEASVYQLLGRTNDGSDHDTRVARARGLSPVLKLMRYLVPTALGISLFLIPVIAAVWRPVVDYLIPLRSLEAGWALGLGACLLLGGQAVTLVSVLQLRRSKIRSGLHSSGLFRWSRNPGLLGMYAFYLGLCFLFPCAVLFVGLIPYVWNMHTRVLIEESHLSSRLGAPYASYKTRVPRYLFFE